MNCDVCKKEVNSNEIMICPLLSPRLAGLRDKLCSVCAKRRINSQISQKLMQETGKSLRQYRTKA